MTFPVLYRIAINKEEAFVALSLSGQREGERWP